MRFTRLHALNAILNEVLSLNAQELELPKTGMGRSGSSMKS